MWLLIITFNLIDLDTRTIVRSERVEVPYSSEQACTARVRELVALDDEAFYRQEVGPPGTAIGVPQYPAPWSAGMSWCEQRKQAAS